MRQHGDVVSRPAACVVYVGWTRACMALTPLSRVFCSSTGSAMSILRRDEKGQFAFCLTASAAADTAQEHCGGKERPGADALSYQALEPGLPFLRAAAPALPADPVPLLDNLHEVRRQLQALNRSGRERYAIPFFMDASYDAVMAPLTGDEEPITYPDFMTGYQRANFHHAAEKPVQLQGA